MTVEDFEAMRLCLIGIDSNWSFVCVEDKRTEVAAVMDKLYSMRREADARKRGGSSKQSFWERRYWAVVRVIDRITNLDVEDDGEPNWEKLVEALRGLRV